MYLVIICVACLSVVAVQGAKFPGNCSYDVAVRACRLGKFQNCTVMDVDKKPYSHCYCGVDDTYVPWDDFEYCGNGGYLDGFWRGVSSTLRTYAAVTMAVVVVTLLVLFLLFFLLHRKVAAIYHEYQLLPGSSVSKARKWR